MDHSPRWMVRKLLSHLDHSNTYIAPWTYIISGPSSNIRCTRETEADVPSIAGPDSGVKPPSGTCAVGMPKVARF